MQLHDRTTARFVMKVVHILRNDLMDLAVLFELGESNMRPVRFRGLEPRPAAKAPRPIEASHLGAAHERLKVNRLVPRPRTARAPIIRNTRLGAASSAGQNDQPPGPCDERFEQAARH
jgi:hypothetical protein